MPRSAWRSAVMRRDCRWWGGDFLESYANLLPAEDILAHTEKNHAPAVYAAWLADPRFSCWLVEAGPGKAPVGYMVLSPPDLQLADLAASDLEVKRIYLLHPFQRRGLGRALMEEGDSACARCRIRATAAGCVLAQHRGAGLLQPDRVSSCRRTAVPGRCQ